MPLNRAYGLMAPNRGHLGHNKLEGGWGGCLSRGLLGNCGEYIFEAEMP